jgi:hypothetical protein
MSPEEQAARRSFRRALWLRRTQGCGYCKQYSKSRLRCLGPRPPRKATGHIQCGEERAAAGDQARCGLQRRRLGSIRLEVVERAACAFACGAHQAHHLVCGGGIVPSPSREHPCAETPCSDCTWSPDLLALAACSRAVSRVRPCDGGKRCEDSMQLGAHLRCDSLRARVCPFSLRCRQKPASRPALCKLPLSTVQPNVGFGDVRVVFLVRCAHRVDVVPSLRRFRRCARASRLGRACDFAP